MAYEPKLDGARCLTTVASGHATLQSRQLRPLTRSFPEITEALEERFVDIVLDGELVVCGPEGLDFIALQRRLASTRRARNEAARWPASYVLFDVLSAGGTDLRRYPYQVRRTLLQQLLDDAAPPLALVPMTTDGAAARAWLTGHLDAGIEGVVAKRLDDRYQPGRRAWQKVKTRTSAEAVIGGVLGPLRAPVALVLGRFDEHGRLRVAGRSSVLPRPLRAELGRLLRAAGDEHPWPAVLPSTRFGRAAPVAYVRVEPTVVVELAVDAAVDLVGGRLAWRHPVRYLRPRLDLRAEDLVHGVCERAMRGRAGTSPSSCPS